MARLETACFSWRRKADDGAAGGTLSHRTFVRYTGVAPKAPQLGANGFNGVGSLPTESCGVAPGKRLVRKRFNVLCRTGISDFAADRTNGPGWGVCKPSIRSGSGVSVSKLLAAKAACFSWQSMFTSSPTATVRVIFQRSRGVIDHTAQWMAPPRAMDRFADDHADNARQLRV